MLRSSGWIPGLENKENRRFGVKILIHLLVVSSLKVVSCWNIAVSVENFPCTGMPASLF